MSVDGADRARRSLKEWIASPPKDEARRIAVNIARLPELLGKGEAG